MEKNKHHFVPRFYLKRFAVDREGSSPKQIRLYNISAEKYVPTSNLYNQCYRKKFYGQSDEVEDVLANLEGRFATSLRSIDETDTIPFKNTDTKAYADLLLFIGMQWMRTGRAADLMADQVDKLMKTFLVDEAERNNREDIVNRIDEVRIGYADPIFLSLRRGGKMAVCISDLKAHLIKLDVEDVEFITSDHPIQRYNTYCQGVDWKGVTGTVSTGLQIFVPISPKVCLLLYDGSVYRVGKPNVHQTILSNEEDVFFINGLQYVGAEQNLYFSGNLGAEYFQKLALRFKKARGTPHVVVKSYRDLDDPNRTVMMNIHPTPNLRVDFSFISVRRNARKVSLLDRAQSYRMKVIPPDPFDPDETWEEAIRKGEQIERDRKAGKWVKRNLEERSVR